MWGRRHDTFFKSERLKLEMYMEERKPFSAEDAIDSVLRSPYDDSVKIQYLSSEHFRQLKKGAK